MKFNANLRQDKTKLLAKYFNIRYTKINHICIDKIHSMTCKRIAFDHYIKIFCIR